ncbi:protein chibby homolog 1-like [Oppia nitens]|uniref:protein chibby homolog 1-like n=1 Tax=Oppia nitens TaxID=1686743 RepID=UPI0023DCB03A|nr:protein chibby homolog 1-like [Oppia nitens]
MPLFSNRFSYKKFPSRKLKPLSSLHRELSQSLDFNADNESIKLELGKQLLTFDTKSGQWIQSDDRKDKDISDKTKELETMNELLTQENRILRLKVEILIQMVTEATAELQL